MTTRTTSVLALALALSACGGGDSPPPTSGTPTPSPTSTATLTPTPTPTPTPTVSYTEYDDLTDPQTFQSACATQLQAPLSAATFTSEFGAGLSFAFTPATKQYVVKDSDVDLTFTATDLTTDDANGRVYQKARASGGTDRLSIYNPGYVASPTKYVRFGSLSTLDRVGFTPLTYRCVFGVNTELDDPLPSTRVTYDQFVNVATANVFDSATSNEFYNASKSEIFFRADPATGEVVFQVTLGGDSFSTGTSRYFGNFNGTTTIDGSVKNFSGLLLNSANEVVGKFAGWFFGPSGEEVGIVWNMNTRLSNGNDLAVYSMTIGSNP